MIAKIGFATLDDATVREFVTLTVRCLGEKGGTVAANAVLALMTLHADLSALTAEQHIEAIDVVISQLDTLSELPSDGLEWLLHQPALSAAQFTAIRAKLAARLSGAGRMGPVQQWLDRAAEGDQYRAAWVQQVVRAAIAAVNDYANRATVPILMGLLPLLRPSQSQMEPVLNALFCPDWPHTGFWFVDAVDPCIQYLAPDFCLSFARLVTQWAGRRIPLDLDSFQRGRVAEQLTEPGRQCLVRACLEILAARTAARDLEQDLLLRHDDPIAYLVHVEPATVLPILLDGQAAPLLEKNANVITLAHRVECLRRYAALREFAITATVEAGGCALHLFASDKHMHLPASPEFIREVQELANSRPSSNHDEAALQAHAPASHAAAASVFVVQSPWSPPDPHPDPPHPQSPSDSKSASSASASKAAPVELDGPESLHSEADEEPQAKRRKLKQLRD
jgi:hypothetical protein